MTYTAADRARIMDRRYRKIRAGKLLRGEPTGLVSADQAAEHVKRLVDLGWSCAAIHQMTRGAVSDTTVVNLSRRRHSTIERETDKAIRSVPLSLYVPASVADTAKVPLAGAQRRIHALMRLGWIHSTMRNHAGVDTSHIARGTYPQIVARKWRAVDAMFTDLAMQQGPSRLTASRAIKLGYAPPLAWDDVDDPNERPTGYRICSKPGCAGEHRAKGLCKVHYAAQNDPPAAQSRHRPRDLDPLRIERILLGEHTLPCSKHDKAEVCRRWVANGGTLKDLERLTGWKPERYWKIGDAA